MCRSGPFTVFGPTNVAFLALGPNIIDFVANGYNAATNGNILTVSDVVLFIAVGSGLNQ